MSLRSRISYARVFPFLRAYAARQAQTTVIEPASALPVVPAKPARQARVFSFLVERARRQSAVPDAPATIGPVTAELAPPPAPHPVAPPQPSPEPVVEEKVSPPRVEPVAEATESLTGQPVQAELNLDAAPVVEPVVEVPAPVPEMDWLARMRAGLARTRDRLQEGFAELFSGGVIDEDALEELETILLTSDVGVDATEAIVSRIREQASGGDDLQTLLRKELLALLAPCEQPLVPETGDGTPYVILVVGVNGVGKTTTIGKLAHRFKDEGRSVMLAAGDTFRAAAVEQLQVWGERNDVPVVAQQTGADSAAVIFDAVESAKARGVDVVIADTAGRLHNKDNLMDELSKVARVIGKVDAAAPHEVLLVLDAGTGQNALAQAATFQEAVKVSGIAMTKLDGTARGGILFAVAQKLQIPIRFIGIGEQAQDLRPFAAEPFVDALIG